MRDLTEEELKLAPHDCDHYNIIDDKVYFTDVLGIYVCDINGVEVDNLIMDSMVFTKSVPLPKKPFSIAKYEFSDGYLSASIDGDALCMAIELDSFNAYAKLDKCDAIAIAKSLGVTADDLI